MNNIRKCPNCIQSAGEGYKQGFADAMKQFQEEMSNAIQLRPIQITVPENYVMKHHSTVLYKLGKDMYVNNEGDTVIVLADDEIRMFNKIIEEEENSNVFE